MAIEIFDLILIALFAGIGNAIGQPIGKAIYDYLHNHFRQLKKLALDEYE